jgi:hypothetical protein
MHALLGHQLPMGMPRDWTLADRIRHGHAFLVRIAEVDLGYEPVVWHEHLRAADAGGYRWSNKHLGFPRQIRLALADPAWHRAVASLHALDPRCRTADVLGLARGITAERAFDRLPILADALQDAGCEDEQLLSHCRRAGADQVDSWVVHLVLGAAGEPRHAEPGAAPDPAI